MMGASLCRAAMTCRQLELTSEILTQASTSAQCLTDLMRASVVLTLCEALEAARPCFFTT